MNLDEYLKARDKDSNLFWRLESGVHQNLLDEAIYKIEELESKLDACKNNYVEQKDLYAELWLENKRLNKLLLGDKDES